MQTIASSLSLPVAAINCSKLLGSYGVVFPVRFEVIKMSFSMRANSKPHKENYPITSKNLWVPRFKIGSKGEVLSSEGEKCGKQLRPHVAIINQARTNTAGKSTFQ